MKLAEMGTKKHQENQWVWDMDKLIKIKGLLPKGALL